jgi:hypothetical protein
MTLVVVAFVLLVCAALPYVFVESRWRWRWREIEAGRVRADDTGGGVYRSGGDVPRYLERAPQLVRVAAYSCFLFGQMFVPGLVVGVFGVLFFGIGIVSVPGLITAALLYRAGFALLRRERTAFFKARDAAAWALWLNGLILVGSFMLATTPLRPMSHGAMRLFLFVDGYGVASIAQALVLRRAARTWQDALFAVSAACG